MSATSKSMESIDVMADTYATLISICMHTYTRTHARTVRQLLQRGLVPKALAELRLAHHRWHDQRRRHPASSCCSRIHACWSLLLLLLPPLAARVLLLLLLPTGPVHPSCRYRQPVSPSRSAPQAPQSGTSARFRPRSSMTWPPCSPHRPSAGQRGFTSVVVWCGCGGCICGLLRGQSQVGPI